MASPKPDVSVSPSRLLQPSKQAPISCPGCNSALQRVGGQMFAGNKKATIRQMAGGGECVDCPACKHWIHLPKEKPKEPLIDGGPTKMK